MSINWHYSLALLVTFAALCAPAAASVDEDQEALGFLLSGMQAARTALKSGMCAMNGRYVARAKPDGDAALDGPLEILFAFEGKSKWRFDRSQPGWLVDPENSKDDPKEPGRAIASFKKGQVTQKYCRNGKKDAFWQADQSEISVAADNQSGPPQGWEYFDVMALGLYHRLALQRGYDLSKVLEGWRSAKLSYLNKTDPNTWLVVWSIDESQPQLTTEWLLWVDVQKGFTPVRYENRQRGGGASWTTIEESKTDWRDESGVWVPVRHESHHTPPDAPWSNEFWFDLKWEKVNQPISTGIFVYEGFNAPNYVGVVDNALGEPIVLKNYQPSLRPRPRAWNSRLMWGAGIGCSVLLVGASIWIYRRYRRLTPNR